MNKMRIHNFLAILILFTTILTANVLAAQFGLSPGLYVFEYDAQKGVQEELTFSLHAASDGDILVEVNVIDGLKEYVQVDKETLVFRRGEPGIVNVKVNIPPYLNLVGNQQARVEFAEKSSEEGLMVFTKTYRGIIQVRFPYPNEYIVIESLSPVHTGVGQNTIVNWQMQARGQQTTTVTSELNIKNEEGEIIFYEQIEPFYLSFNEIKQGTINIPSQDYLAGNYFVTINANSSDNQETRSATLKVGKEDIGLVSFNPRTFNVGEFFEFEFILENYWNKDFNNVYAVVSFDDVSMTTKTVSLNAFGKVKLIKQLIDLRKFEEGPIKGTLTVYFDQNTKDFDIELTGIIPEEEEEQKSPKIWLIIIIVTIIIIALILIVLFEKTNKEAKNKRV